MAADDFTPPSNNLPPIPFNHFSAEELKILHPNKTIEEATPSRVLRPGRKISAHLMRTRLQALAKNGLTQNLIRLSSMPPLRQTGIPCRTLMI